MPKIASVKFKSAGKAYDFCSGAFVLKKKDSVIVETENGLAFGTIFTPPYYIEKTEKQLKQILRVANNKDFTQLQKAKELEEKALKFCMSCISDLDLQMNLFQVESTFSQSKLIFSYTAESRVDFRELIKLLIKEFSIRIEMKQVGNRNLLKHCGGCGKCGRELCCISFMNKFEQVSIKMAKEQGLSLNPTKISGLCGRLMCCLTFENETYKTIKKTMPKVGAKIQFKGKKAKIVRHNVLKQNVIIKMEDDEIEIEKNINELNDIKNAK